MRARTAARLAWSSWGLTLALVAGSFVLLFLNRHTAVPTGGLGGSSDLTFPIVFLVFSTVGAVVAARHPSNAIGWIFCATGLSVCLATFTHQYSIYEVLTRPGSLPGRDLVLWLETWTWVPGAQLTGTFLLLLFPTGRLLSPRWRIVAWVSVVALIVLAVGVAFAPGPLLDFPGIDNAYGVSSLRWANAAGPLISLAASMACVASLIVRFRRSRGEERAQMKWFVLGAVVLVAVLIPVILEPGRTPEFLTVLMGLAFGLLAIAAGIAILKYRLYDIDVVIRKTVVFGALALFLGVVYVGVVVGIGSVIVGSQTSPINILTFAAAAIVALAFQPVRAQATRLADRLVYGKRANPYEVLSGFSTRVAGTYAGEDLLPSMARIVAEGIGAKSAVVWLRLGSELRASASWPQDSPGLPPVPLVGNELPLIPGAERAYAVRHQGDLLGAVTVTKPASDPITEVEEKLVSDLASQAGLVLRNVRLTEELKANLEELTASRQRIVAAQDAERRRLERNIHDGAQQQLVSLSVRLGLARALASKDPAGVDGALAELQGETQEALENLRDLARGIYPPLLADQGLVAALQSQSRKVSIPVNVQSDGIGRYPQDVEAAVYFCTLEALQNIAKYAKASNATIRLHDDGGVLAFEVRDDGRGFDTSKTSYGTGLQGMADRLAAQGGTLEVESEPGTGTTIRGRIPSGPVL